MQEPNYVLGRMSMEVNVAVSNKKDIGSAIVRICYGEYFDAWRLENYLGPCLGQRTSAPF